MAKVVCKQCGADFSVEPERLMAHYRFRHPDFWKRFKAKMDDTNAKVRGFEKIARESGGRRFK